MQEGTRNLSAPDYSYLSHPMCDEVPSLPERSLSNVDESRYIDVVVKVPLLRCLALRAKHHHGRGFEIRRHCSNKKAFFSQVRDARCLKAM